MLSGGEIFVLYAIHEWFENFAVKMLPKLLSAKKAEIIKITIENGKDKKSITTLNKYKCNCGYKLEIDKATCNSEKLINKCNVCQGNGYFIIEKTVIF